MQVGISKLPCTVVIRRLLYISLKEKTLQEYAFFGSGQSRAAPRVSESTVIYSIIPQATILILLHN